MAMNIGVSQVPFKLTPEDMGRFNLPQAMGAGMELAFKPSNLTADLLKKQLENMFQAPRSALAKEFAQTELQGKQQDVYLTMANVQKALAEGDVQRANAVIEQFVATQFGGKNPQKNLAPGNYIRPNQLMGAANQPNYPTQQPIGQQNVNMPGREAINIAHQQNPQEGQQITAGQNLDQPQGEAAQSGQQQYISPNLIAGNKENEVQNYNWFRTPPKIGIQEAAVNQKIYGSSMSPQEQAQQAVEQAQIQEEEKNATIDSTVASNNVSNSINMQKIVDDLEESAKRMNLLQKGPLFGNIKAYSEDAQKYDADLNKLVMATATNFAGDSQITDAKTMAASLSKPPRTMNDEARSNIFSFLTAMNQRSIDLANMDQALIQKKIPKRAREFLKSQYNQLRPFYNSTVTGRNTNYEGTWGDFITPDAIMAAKEGRSYKPSNQDYLESLSITPKEIRRMANEVRKKNPSSPYATEKAIRKRLRDQGVI